MKTKIKVEKEIIVSYVEVDVPLGGEEVPDNLPFTYLRNKPRRANQTEIRWKFTVDIDSGKILNWPADFTQPLDLCLKPVDAGIYTLFDDNNNVIKKIEDYVPNSLIPGEYGDYIEVIIDAKGVIKNWPKRPSLIDFFPECRECGNVK